MTQQTNKFSYDFSLKNSTDRIRFLIGDTDPDDVLFTDEEINSIMVMKSTAEKDPEAETAVSLSYALASRFARRADIAVGGLRDNLLQLAKHYWLLGDGLTKSAEMTQAFDPKTHRFGMAYKSEYGNIVYPANDASPEHWYIEAVNQMGEDFHGPVDALNKSKLVAQKCLMLLEREGDVEISPEFQDVKECISKIDVALAKHKG